MLPEFSVLIEEFEQLSLDDKAFFSFKNDSSLEVSIMYKRAEGSQPWTVWFNLSEEASKQKISRGFLEPALTGFEVDSRELAKQVAYRLLTQAAYADELVRKVGQLLGEDALRESIRTTQEFMENLQAMVSQVLGDSSPSLKSEKKSSHLRIVKGE
jgi:hypothetical protein